MPIRAEFLASIGFPLLDRSIQAFKKLHEDKVIEVSGLVFNDFVRKSKKREHRLAREDVQAKAAEHGWHVFQHHIPGSDSYLRAAREGTAIFNTKAARDFVKNEFRSFAIEFFARIGIEV